MQYHRIDLDKQEEAAQLAKQGIAAIHAQEVECNSEIAYYEGQQDFLYSVITEFFHPWRFAAQVEVEYITHYGSKVKGLFDVVKIETLSPMRYSHYGIIHRHYGHGQLEGHIDVGEAYFFYVRLRPTDETVAYMNFELLFSYKGYEAEQTEALELPTGLSFSNPHNYGTIEKLKVVKQLPDNLKGKVLNNE